MHAKTLLCVPILVDTPERAREEAEHARLAGAELVEYRLDACYGGRPEEIEALLRLVAGSPLPCIATCRPVWEGGEYRGDEDARLELLRALAHADRPPRYIDIELAAIEKAGALPLERGNEDAEPRLVLSIHDFEGRPPDLARRLLRLHERPASVHKIAFRARSVRDNLELFGLLAQRNRPTIALGMGRFGLASRVLAPKFGGFLTFAPLRADAATAPGQATLAELLETYRIRSVGPRTRVFGVVGDPVEHSLSPALHNAGFDRVGFDGVYVPLPVAEGYESLKASLGELLDHEGLDLTGVSVTMPHKRTLVRLAAERGWQLDDFAALCGSANTLVRSEPGATPLVTNTDGPAVVECLERAGLALVGSRVLVVGAGGMARAAALALSRTGATITVHSRTSERAAEVAEMVRAAGGDAATLDEITENEVSGLAAIVHATPVGMTDGPAAGGLAVPVDAIDALPREALVVETIYHPVDTPLLRTVRERGLRVVDGLDVFAAQAAAQFELFTNGSAPREVFDAMLRERSGSQGP
ncbi:MAG: type I 3-dehydroquinate dehydratase [Planctomycetota bacterium]